MEYLVFAIRDQAVNSHMVPMFFLTKGQAVRAFSDEVNRKDPNNNLNRHPEDFVLYHLGTYDDYSGLLTAVQPSFIASAQDFRID
ncbi:MAG: nonstructural protein [Microvirus sp.]|nr:MAG: nonstructural protein [Microvirus sp.]